MVRLICSLLLISYCSFAVAETGDDINETSKKLRFTVFSYAQPGYYDEEDNITGSNTVESYSNNTTLLIQQHIRKRYGKNTAVKRLSGKYYKDIHYKIEDEKTLTFYCNQHNSDYVIASFSENSGGRFIHFRYVNYVLANCKNKKIYKNKYKLERDDNNDKFGFEVGLQRTMNDFLSKVPDHF